MGDGLSELFEQADFAHAGLAGAVSPEDLFSILENFEDAVSKDSPLFNGYDSNGSSTNLLSPGSVRPFADVDQADDEAPVQARKKLKTSTGGPPGDSADASAVGSSDGLQKVSHITVERNRRKQMNEHLTVLRSLMPSFYVKRGDQASIIGGVIDYIKELQQVLRSLEAKKQRKVYSEVLSPRPLSSPRPSPLSPRPLPPSPRVVLPISPRTPQPGSPYKPRLQQSYLSPALTPSHRGSSPPSFDSGSVASSELAANSKSPVADVEVKFSGANLLLKTVSQRIPGQATKIIAALEGLALEILHVNINTVDDTMLNSFTIKIGIECELSAEELAQQVQHTFS